MKLIWLIMLSSITLRAAFAQTYIEPMVGLSFSKNVGYPIEGWENRIISDENFNNKNWLPSLGITQKLTDRVYLQLSGVNSKQSARYRDIGFVGYSAIKFMKTSFSIMPIYQFPTRFEFGLGFDYARLYKFQLGLPRMNYWYYLDKVFNHNQMGWSVRFGYSYKSIVLGFRYQQLYALKPWQYQMVKKSNHIDLTLSYRLKISGWLNFRKKKVDCPEISK